MKSEMIFVGTELLLGNITNTNAVFLSQQLAMLGIPCYYQSVVGDNDGRLRETLEMALKRSDIIFLSGGLGPTEDDMTKETAAALMGRTLYEDERARENICEILGRGGYVPTENNWKQAMVPEGSLVLYNENGTAPGIIIEEGEKKVILLPGPPNELLPMFKDQVRPYLEKLTGGTIVSKMVKVCGVGESLAETMIKDLIDGQSNPTIATYAKTREVHIRVTASAENEEKGRKLIKPVVKELKSRFGVNIYTTDEDVDIESCIVDLLKENELQLTTAESCTGGLVSAKIINVPGASEVFNEGFITYSNKAKRKYLGVRKSTLEKYGPVSEQTAKEMAEGGCKAAKSDICVAVTGIAGPEGGSEETPVGLVYIAVCVDKKVSVKEFRFSGNRAKIRESAAVSALVFLRESLLEYFSRVTLKKNKKK